MKFDYTVRFKPVDVIINSNFKGNYYICDPIEVGVIRVNILKEAYENNLNMSDNKGGYLLEIDAEYYIGKNISNQIKEYMKNSSSKRR